MCDSEPNNIDKLFPTEEYYTQEKVDLKEVHYSNYDVIVPDK